MTKIGKGYSVQVTDIEKVIGLMNTFNVELVYGDRVVCNLSTCRGEKSAEYWSGYWIKIMKRFMHLINAIDIQNNNLLAYSKNLLLDGPKSGYEEKWVESQEELNMLYAWLQDITDGFDEKMRISIMNEFGIYYR